MNICLCGAQAGYPHDEFCPFPLFRGTEKQERKWQAEWEAKRKAAREERGVTGCCQVPLLSNGCMFPSCELFVPKVQS